MRPVLKRLILLYPKSWRNRYGNEFGAFLDEVPPTWPTLFDVLGGALKMQMKPGNLLKAAGIAVGVALLAGVTFGTLAGQYRSEAVIHANKTQLNAEARTILGRANLTRLILRENLYQKDRARVPPEELALRLRSSALIWSERKDGPMRIRVYIPDAAQAQRAAQSIADAFVDAKAAALVDPANLPTHPNRPPLLADVQFGLVVGLLAASLFALFNGLKVWKPVAALGVAGTVLGVAAASVIPNIYRGLSVVSVRTSDATAVGEVIDSATDPARLAAIVRQFNLYLGDPQAVQKLREHLTLKLDLRPFGNPATGTARGSYDIVINFKYPDQTLAQIVTEAVAAYLTDENVQRPSGIAVEMVAPAFVHAAPHIPNRLIGSGTGLALGLVSAVMLGIWRMFANRPRLRHA